MERKKRRDYIDIVKGISILTITFVHFEDGVIPRNLNVWFGSYMITAFYFVSGWLHGFSEKDISPKELIKKRWRSLGIPYIWFSGIILLFDILLIAVNYYPSKVLWTDLYKALCLRGIGTLWFLPALFVGEVIFTWLKKKKYGYKLLFLAAAIGYFWLYGKLRYTYRSESDLSKIIDAPFYALRGMLNAAIVIYTGYVLCRVSRKKVQNLSAGKIGLIGIILLIFSYLSANYTHNILPDFLNKDIVWMFIAPIVGPFAWIILSYQAERFSFNRFFAFWGRNSLILMATHYSIFLVLCKMINTAFTGEEAFTGMQTIYYFIATILVEFPIVYFINKKAKFLLGR